MIDPHTYAESFLPEDEVKRNARAVGEEMGDLLFYSYKGTISSIHHITIYAGNGMMWEANSKGKGLLYSNIYSIKGLMPFGGRV